MKLWQLMSIGLLISVIGTLSLIAIILFIAM